MGKLVFLDIDGTIINFNKEISESTIKSAVREALGRYLFEVTRRRPMILPIIMEV